MLAQLTFVGEASLVTTPLFLFNALPDRLLIQFHIEGLTEADTSSFVDGLLDAATFTNLSKGQRHVLLLNDSFGSEEVSIALDRPLAIIESLCEQISLISAIDALTSVLGRLIVANVDALRLQVGQQN